MNSSRSCPLRTFLWGAVGGHATPISPAEAGGGHCPAVNGTMMSPQPRSPAPGCQDIPDVQVQPASSMAAACPQGPPWPLRLPQEHAGSPWAHVRSRPQLAQGQRCQTVAPASAGKPLPAC